MVILPNLGTIITNEYDPNQQLALQFHYNNDYWYEQLIWLFSVKNFIYSNASFKYYTRLKFHPYFASILDA